MILTPRPGTIGEARFGEKPIRYWVPPLSGGYVRAVSAERPGTLGAQICSGLRWSGSTLSARPGRLLALIRREARLALAEERREQQSARSWR